MSTLNHNTDRTPFLLTSTGCRYDRAFRRLRIAHLLNHPIDLNIILEDNLIPRTWLSEPLLLQWNNMLKFDQNLDTGYELRFARAFLAHDKILFADQKNAIKIHFSSRAFGAVAFYKNPAFRGGVGLALTLV